MTIRNVSVRDAPIITKVAENCLPFLRPSVEGTYEFLARCFQNTFFVFEENTEIVGFIVGFPNTAAPGEFWIYQCAILSEWRGRGIGSKLFEALFRQVRSEGYKRVRSHYKFDNQHSANLHSKFNMKICGKDARGYFVEAIIEGK